MYILENKSFDNATDFLAAINKSRLANKNQWVGFTGKVAGYDVRYKAFETYIQIFELNGLRFHSTYEGMKVGEWKNYILECLKECK